MFPHRHDDEQIDKYTGPYERWIFSRELGRPFAFPAIRNGPSTHITALMEGDGMLADTDDIDIRIPPLWSKHPHVTPFAMWNKAVDPDDPAENEDAELARCLHALNGSRYRLNMPVDPATWPRDPANKDAKPPGWTRPKTKPRVIIGVIDDGLPFMHRAFRDSAGDTRITLCWLQSARADTAAAVPFGREITATQIDQLRAEQAGAAGAAALYQCRAGRGPRPARGRYRADASRDTRCAYFRHCSRKRSLCRGRRPTRRCRDHRGAASQYHRLGHVRVRQGNTMMPSAIEYIFHRARMIAQALWDDDAEIRLVRSTSATAGAQTAMMANQALSAASKTRSPNAARGAAHHELVMPTGAISPFCNNVTCARTVRVPMMHQTGRPSFGWHLKPDDRTSSYLEIWLPPGIDPQGWTVTVTPPPGIPEDVRQTLSISPDPELDGGDPRRFVELEMGGKNSFGQLSADKHFESDRWRVMLATIPTAASWGGTARASGSGTSSRLRRRNDPSWRRTATSLISGCSGTTTRHSLAPGASKAFLSISPDQPLPRVLEPPKRLRLRAATDASTAHRNGAIRVSRCRIRSVHIQTVRVQR